MANDPRSLEEIDAELEAIRAERDRRGRSLRTEMGAQGQPASVETIDRELAALRAERERRAMSPRQRAVADRPQNYSEAAGVASTASHGATIGLSDEIRGVQDAVSAFGAGLRDPSLADREFQVATPGGPVVTRGPAPQTQGNPSLSDRLSGAWRTATRAYNQGAETERGRREQFYAERPAVATATEIAGGLVSPANALRVGQLGRSLPVVGGGGLRELGRGGAIYGLGYAAATGENLQERTDLGRLGGGALGGATGGVVLGAAGRAVGSTAGAGLNLLSRMGLNPDQRALRLINRALQRQQAGEDDLVRRGMSRPDARRLVQSGQAPRLEARDLRGRINYVQNRGAGTNANPSPTAEMNFEMMGAQGRSMANAAANVAGPGRDIAAGAFARRSTGGDGPLDPFVTQQAQRAAESAGGGRPGTVTDRMLSAARRALPTQQTRVPQTYTEYADALQAARSGQAREAYRVGLDADPPGDALQNQIIPIMRDLPQNARAAAARSGADQLGYELTRLNTALRTAAPNEVAALQRQVERATEARTQLEQLAAGNTPNNANIWALDYFQRGLQQFESGLARGSPEAGAVAGARRLYNDTLRELAPAWGDAHAQYGRSMRLSDLLEDGRQILRSPERLDVVMQTLRSRNLSVDERDALVVGVLESLDAKLAQGDTAFVARIMRRRDWQEALAQVMGARNFRDFNFQVVREMAMRRNENAVMAGSKTARTQEDITDMTEGEAEMGFFREALQSGNLQGPIFRRMADAWDRWAQGGVRNPDVNRALSRRLFQTAVPGNVDALVTDIGALPGYARVGALGDPTGRAIGGAGAIYGGIEANKRRRIPGEVYP